jgi:hypothetical protein
MDSLNTIKLKLQQSRLKKVKDLWIPTHEWQFWRKWKTSRLELQITEEVNLTPWQECMQNRKIPSKEGPDVLR